MWCHSLPLVMGRDVKGLSGKEKMQCHSLTVDYSRCHETTMQRKNTFTHSLFIVGRNVTRLPSKGKMQYHSHPEMRCDEATLAKKKFQVMCYSHTICHEKKCEEMLEKNR